MPPIILASTSPFRRETLTKLGLEFTSCPPEVDEQAKPGEKPEELVLRLAIEKARAVAQQHSSGLVIGSDQLAVIDGEILGKPGDHANAVRQLQHASGKTVIFYTGLCLFNAETGKYQSEVVPFKVIFRQLSDQQIENYLNAEQPYNCAGSFKSEGLGISLFERLEGEDPNTLIGLPLIRLVRMLEAEGVQII